MTPDEYATASELDTLITGLAQERAIRAALVACDRAIRAAERERCVQVAESFRTTPADYADWSPLPAADDRARRIAAAIRAIPD